MDADLSYTRLKNHLIASTGLAFYMDRDEELSKLIGQRLTDLRLPDCSSYAEFLADRVKGDAEMDVMISRLTIGETSFFRDPELFTAIRDVILPEILERKQSLKQLRIWSAGCATGAEPYSLAILLARELSDRIADWEISIHATDLNRAFLAKAEEGKFRAWTLRSIADDVKHQCFSQEGSTWTIHPRYKQWISFQQMNLVESSFSIDHFDLILCRNVMIYFSPEVNRSLIGRFHQSLESRGWLIVGATEHNLEHYNAFSAVDAAGVKLYQKTPPENRPLEVIPEPKPRPWLTPVAKPHPSPVPASKPDLDIEVLRQFADGGDWEGGLEYGRRLLAQDRLNPEIHYYLALIFENLAIVGEPQRSLRQALYLDRNFALAHYHLGLALKRDGEIGGAARSFANVLKVLNHIPDYATVRAGRGITSISLKQLARMHLQSQGA